MKNKEKYAKELMEIAASGKMVAVVNGKPVVCSAPENCKGCLCNNEAIMVCVRKRIREWAESEYEEPPVDWSKVPVDTKILVSNDSVRWYKRYFCKFENGEVYAFDNGSTSWSCRDTDGIREDQYTEWEYAKLAEEQIC